MYSAFMAEVPDPRDPSTELDRGLMAKINEADTLIICGQGNTVYYIKLGLIL